MRKLIVEKKQRIAYITLNRPETKNAIDKELHHLLVQAWREFDADESVDVAILTGNGDAFCAGMDLKTFVPEVVGADAQAVLQIADMGLGGITRGLHRLRKPVIAAVNGWALAAGLELALAADIRIASEHAFFGSFEARRGFHHGDGGIPRLMHICGTGIALELVITAEPINAWRAHEVGLVSRVVAPSALLSEAETLAGTILRNDQAAVRSAKATVLDMIGRSLDDQLRLEAINAYTRMAAGSDVRRRLQAFYERRDEGRLVSGSRA